MTDYGATQRVPSPGQKVFQRYILRKILGRGGMGIVWLAHDEKLDRNVALKFLPDVVVHDPRAIEELKKEARRNLDLTHPHIVRIYDFVDDADGAAIAMEYVKGDSLSKLAVAQPDGTFTVNRLRPWVQQFCEALTYAHEEAKVVHRDLKPANLMLDGQDRVKVTDFGIARSIAESVSRISAQAGSSGTPSYMSPQQMMGELPSVADDVYSVGATLYELLTGKPPFYTGDVIAQVQGKVPPSVTQRRRELGLADPPTGAPFITPAWEETIAACLAKERDQRPESAEDVAERLGLTEQNQASRKTRPRLPPPPAAPPPSAPVVAPAAPPAPASSRAPLFAAIAVGAVLVAAAGWFWGTRQGKEGAVTRYTPSQQPPPASAEAAPVVAPVVAPVASVGSLVVRSEPPGADVAVGTFDHGTSPLTLKEIRLGRYPVKIQAPGYEEWNGEVEVRADKFAELDATLVHSSGRVVIVGAPAGAEVSDATGRLGVLPLTLDHMPVGPVQFTVQARGYQPATVAGDLGRNAELHLTAVLDKIPVIAAGQPWIIADLRLEMMPVPAGSFTMGSTEGEWDEKPLMQVTLSHPFWLGKTEVTQAQWHKVMGKDPSSFKGPDQPVEQVSWTEAVDFCRRLTERGHTEGWLPQGYTLTLPTEAQWEYACRAGTTDNFGGRLEFVGWYSGNSEDHTHVVERKRANAWGLADMHGNVWEWCLDWYGTYPGGSVTDPAGAASGPRRVIRGGSWSSVSNRCRASVRDGWKPGERGNDVGLRLALVQASTP